ncbi:MAG: carboxypeptidase-like regulatory domain-containing protein, partial [Saprospiraceae bacterium]
MPLFFRCILFIVGLHLTPFLAAQQPLDLLLRFQCDRCAPAEALVALSRQSGVNIVFNDQFFKDCPPVNFSGEPLRLGAILDRFSDCGRVSYRELDGSIVFYRKIRRFSISGFVQDAETGERIIGASVRAGTGKNAAAISNEFGFFSLTLEEGAYTLAVNALGYQSRFLPVSLEENRKLTVALRADLALPEVVVSGQVLDTPAQRIGPDPNIPALGSLSGMPMPGGEADLLRLVAMQPGVQSGVDGLGGLHIRGGNSDQNLILLDDVPVYNP